METEVTARIDDLVKPLLDWYSDNKRSLPWREAPSPYHVWISEIMLQQTRIEAVMGYYERFLDRLPTARDLAAVDDDELMKLWEGLGYYSRARNLKKAAVRLVEEYDGELPADYELLVKLPGIGAYTAGAIASIAFGLPEPAVDGNVLRVLMRYLDRDDDVMSQKLRRETEEALRNVMRRAFVSGEAHSPDGQSPDAPVDDRSAGDFTQALMELGEVVCIPNGEPLCEKCPLREKCQGRISGRAAELPVRKAKTKRRIEKRTVFLIRDDEGRVLLRKRPETGLLAGLWELPSVEGHIKKKQVTACVADLIGGMTGETAEKKTDHEAQDRCPDPERGDVRIESVECLPPARHIFSHIEWDMTGYEIRMAPHHIVGGVWAKTHDLDEKYALPTAFSAFIRHT